MPQSLANERVILCEFEEGPYATMILIREGQVSSRAIRCGSARSCPGGGSKAERLSQPCSKAEAVTFSGDDIEQLIDLLASVEFEEGPISLTACMLADGVWWLKAQSADRRITVAIYALGAKLGRKESWVRLVQMDRDPSKPQQRSQRRDRLTFSRKWCEVCFVECDGFFSLAADNDQFRAGSRVTRVTRVKELAKRILWAGERVGIPVH